MTEILAFILGVLCMGAAVRYARKNPGGKAAKAVAKVAGGGGGGGPDPTTP